MKYTYRHVLILLIIIIISSCQVLLKDDIPETEIVYQSEAIRDSFGHKLGFVNADGTNNQIIEPKYKFEKPIWSYDAKFLYGLSGGTGSYMGYPAYWSVQNGSIKACSNNLPFSFQIQGYDNPENPYEVVLLNRWTINLYDISTCRQIETFIDYTNRFGSYGLAGFSYSRFNNELVYGLITEPDSNPSYTLILLNLNSYKETTLGEGIFPAWSPDGTKIAYIGLNGLYILNYPNSNKPQLLVEKQFFNPKVIGGEWSFTTVPSWSPDSDFLVYHRCNTADICKPQESTIYKINIYNPKEEVVVLGGEYPNWKP